MRKFVGYYRVSTSSQWKSGLGLEAQKAAVANYVRAMAGNLVVEFEDVESGALVGRPGLQSALKYCRTHKCVLVIAKLDRLARNLHFISQLLESGVEFVATDMPAANKLTIHIIAAMAEYERDAIADRTRAALKAAKARGVKLGSPDIAKLSTKGVQANKDGADTFARSLMPVVEGLRARGINSYAQMAHALEAAGVATRRRGRWTAASVRNLVLRQRTAAGA